VAERAPFSSLLPFEVSLIAVLFNCGHAGLMSLAAGCAEKESNFVFPLAATKMRSDF
jgi:hypothetical protein